MMRSFYSTFLTILSIILFLSCGTEPTPIYNLTTSVEGEGIILPSGGEYEEGEKVTLTANPTEHWVLDSWSGDGSGSSTTLTITMDSDKNVVGNFQRRDYPLTITIDGEGTVEEQIISSPKTTDYPYETVVELTPNPSTGWKFVEWGGDIFSSDEVVTVKVDGEVNITVTFERIDYPLTIIIEGEGTVEQEVVQSKTTDYPYETGVQLSSKPDDGWVFYEWSGDLDGNDNPQTIGIDEGKEVTSVFKSIDELLTIEIIGEGTVDIQQETFENDPSRRTVKLTPNPSNGWNFVEWSGDISSTEEVIEITIDGVISLTATFEEAWSRDTETEIVEVISPTGRIWMDRNLGASRAATSFNDSEAYGDLFQWGREADDHQKRNSSITSTRSNSDQPGHGLFIRTNTTPPLDWRSPRNDNLWQGLNGINNPCPKGFRLPTEAEWNDERNSWSSENRDGAFFSPLKLPAAGYRLFNFGPLRFVGDTGYYWSDTVDDSNAQALQFRSFFAEMFTRYRAYGFSVRCIKE